MKKRILGIFCTITFASSALFFVACTSLQKGARERANKVLTKEQAMDRSERINQVAYTLALDLPEHGPHFTGHESVEFELENTQKDITLDYAGKVLKLTVNGKVLEAPTHTGIFVVLPKENLLAGHNRVDIEFQSDFNHSGMGLHQFEDPQDHQVYLYTQFEPFDANKMMPLFDQPDMKATFKLTVTAPAAWQVISTTLPEKTEKTGAQQTWSFKATPRIAPYIFSLHAGPYKVWTSHYKNIPLRLFARESLAASVHPKEWFATTKHGLAYYQSYFDYAYPFEKYDQLIVPEFNAGAMENAGAVTFSERYIKRGHRGFTDRMSLANVILHEMAHMWFGDLVTMKWWNDLWLNESFATYMAALSLSHIPAYSQAAWMDFFEDKSWAYHEDQLVTTHPIEAPVQNTDDAMVNFDGITYGKGASVIKQLSYALGPDVFRDGVRSYFKAHAFKNTTLADFIAALASQTAHPEELSKWADAWLRTSGVDHYAVRFTCEGKKLATLTVQSTLEEPTRPQSVELALLDLSKGHLDVASTVAVKLQGEKTLVPAKTLEGKACPTVVALNHGDHGYVLQSWDKDQASILLSHVGKIKDPLLRYQVWRDFHEMMMRAKMKPHDFAQMALWNLPDESSDHILKFVLGALAGTGRGDRSVFELAGETDSRQKDSFEALLWNEVLRPTRSLDQRYMYFDALAKSFMSPNVREKMAALLDGKLRIPRLKLDADRRWAVIIRFCALGDAGCADRIAAESKKDTSQRGHNFALAAQSALPVQTAKEQGFQKLHSADLSLEEKRQILRHLLPYDQAQFRRQFSERIYNEIKDQLPSQAEPFQEAFIQYLNPGFCDSKSVERLRDLQSGRRFGSVIEKSLKVRTQEEERCMAVRAASTGPDIR